MVVPGLVAVLVLVLLVLAIVFSVARESFVDWLPVHPRTSSSRFPFPRAHSQCSVDRHRGTVSVEYMRSSCHLYPPLHWVCKQWNCVYVPHRFSRSGVSTTPAMCFYVIFCLRRLPPTYRCRNVFNDFAAYTPELHTHGETGGLCSLGVHCMCRICFVFLPQHDGDATERRCFSPSTPLAVL